MSRCTNIFFQVTCLHDFFLVRKLCTNFFSADFQEGYVRFYFCNILFDSFDSFLGISSPEI